MRIPEFLAETLFLYKNSVSFRIPAFPNAKKVAFSNAELSQENFRIQEFREVSQYLRQHQGLLLIVSFRPAD